MNKWTFLLWFQCLHLGLCGVPLPASAHRVLTQAPPVSIGSWHDHHSSASFLFSGVPPFACGAVRSLIQWVPSLWQITWFPCCLSGRRIYRRDTTLFRYFHLPFAHTFCTPSSLSSSTSCFECMCVCVCVHIIFPTSSVTSASCLLSLSKTQVGVVEKRHSLVCFGGGNLREALGISFLFIHSSSQLKYGYEELKKQVPASFPKRIEPSFS